ncbi:hypothetical protein O0544_03365 [Edwardsiella anguillarum]|nr:hypothetical protein [Edwardsiella anguillarum]
MVAGAVRRDDAAGAAGRRSVPAGESLEIDRTLDGCRLTGWRRRRRRQGWCAGAPQSWGRRTGSCCG